MTANARCHPRWARPGAVAGGAGAVAAAHPLPGAPPPAQSGDENDKNPGPASRHQARPTLADHRESDSQRWESPGYRQSAGPPLPGVAPVDRRRRCPGGTDRLDPAARRPQRRDPSRCSRPARSPCQATRGAIRHSPRPHRQTTSRDRLPPGPQYPESSQDPGPAAGPRPGRHGCPRDSPPPSRVGPVGHPPAAAVSGTARRPATTGARRGAAAAGALGSRLVPRRIIIDL